MGINHRIYLTAWLRYVGTVGDCHRPPGTLIWPSRFVTYMYIFLFPSRLSDRCARPIEHWGSCRFRWAGPISLSRNGKLFRFTQTTPTADWGLPYPILYLLCVLMACTDWSSAHVITAPRWVNESNERPALSLFFSQSFYIGKIGHLRHVKSEQRRPRYTESSVYIYRCVHYRLPFDMMYFPRGAGLLIVSISFLIYFF